MIEEQTQHVQNIARETTFGTTAVRKLARDDNTTYQYSTPKRFEKPTKPLSQSAQHIPLRAQDMHHQLDKEIRDLIGLSLPSLHQLTSRPKTVVCSVEATEVPDDTAQVVSFYEVKKTPSRAHDLSPTSQRRRTRTKPVTEYILQRDDTKSELRSADVIQRVNSERDLRYGYSITKHKPQTSYEDLSHLYGIGSFTSEKYPSSYNAIRMDRQQKQDQNPRHSFHITNYEKWDNDKHPTGTTKNINGSRQCPPPPDYEQVVSEHAKCDVKLPVLSSPPIRRKEIKVRVNEPSHQFGSPKFKMRNTEADVSRVLQYEQELAYSDHDYEEAKFDTLKTNVTSLGSTGTGSEPYPGTLPGYTFLNAPQVAISETSSETSDKDWDSFFRNLDQQNAQLYEVGGSNSDVSEDLDIILYSGCLNQEITPLTTKSSEKLDGSSLQRGMSVEERRQGFKRQGALDHSSPVPEDQPFPFDKDLTVSSTISDDEGSFDRLFKQYEKEEYDNVPSEEDVEEYDNVPSSLLNPQSTSEETGQPVDQSKQVWDLRALLAGQDIPRVPAAAMVPFEQREPDIRYPNFEEGARVGVDMDIGPTESRSVHVSPQEALPDRTNQMERLAAIRGNVEDLLAEVETLQTAIKVSQTQRASSVVSDFPSQRQDRLLSAEELRSTRAKSWDSNVADLNETERRLQDIVASVRTVDRGQTSSNTGNLIQYDVNRQQRSTQSEPRTTDSMMTSSDLGSESDGQDPRREKTPKSILKVKTEKAMTHSGIVRFSEDQVNYGSRRQPQPLKLKRKQVSTMAARSSHAGRSPPTIRKIVLDEKETRL